MGLRKKKSLYDQVVDQASDYVDAVKPHVEAAYESARDFVQDTALPALSDARDKAGPALADAREKAAPYVSDARDKAAPVLSEARDRAAAGLADARSKAAPYVASGAAAAGERATAVRELADAKVAELKGEPVKQKGGKLKKLVLVAAVAGGVAFVAKKLQGGSSGDNWQSSYTPAAPPAAAPGATTRPAPTPAAPQAGVEDAAGSSPDEALADAAEAPHPVTTPDDPAEVVDIDPKKGDAKA